MTNSLFETTNTITGQMSHIHTWNTQTRIEHWQNHSSLAFKLNVDSNCIISATNRYSAIIVM